MPVEPWPTVVVDGKEWWEVDIKARILKESDPDSQVLFLVGTPNGGVGNVGPLVKGDPGVHAELLEEINFTALEPDDATPDSASFTIITPPDDDTPGEYQLNLALHKGLKGDDGDTVLDPGDFDGALVGQILVVGDDEFILQDQKVTTQHRAASLNNVPSGNPSYTLGVITIDAATFDRRLIVAAQAVVVGTGPDVAVDLLARLNGETGGNVIAACRGLAGTKDRLTICPASPAGSDGDFNKINAGDPATVHLRTERQSGSDTYTAANTSMLFEVWAVAI